MPRIQQERALEQESAAMWRLSQTVKQALERVVLEHFLKRSLPGLGPICQAPTH